MKFDPEKALRHRVILIAGEESALRRQALDQTLAAAGILADDFDLQVYDGDSDAELWLASVGTAPFLAERRTVVVRNVLRCDLDVAKELNLKGLPETALLILVADDETGDDDRQKRLKGQRLSWGKLVHEAGGHVVVCDASASDLKQIVKEEFARNDKKVTDRAVDVLSEMCAGSTSRALEEVGKLVAFVGAEKHVQESDVREVVLPSREWNVFRLVDSVVEGDIAESLRQLRILVGSAQKAEEAAFRNILPQLSRSLRLIWQARACIDGGMQPGNATGAVREALLVKPNLATEKDFVRNKAMRAARRVNLVQIAEMLSLVSDADARLKGLLPSFSAMETLEQTVLKMAEVANAKVALR